MVKRYCDHGAYPAYTLHPAFGTAQEGDGLAKAPAASVATASIAFSAPPTSGVLSVFGVNINMSTVLSQASVDTAANNLAAAINNTTIAVGASISNSTPHLRNMVYARGPSFGAPAGTCQVMTRVGAAGLNHSDYDASGNIAAQITTTLNNVTSTAADLKFNGGVSGCYGYFYNNGPVAVWPQVLNTFAYGLLSTTQQPLAGYPGAGDIVHIRSNKELLASSSYSGTFFLKCGGTPQNPTVYDFDDGTEWPEDGAMPRFTMYPQVNGTTSLNWGASAGAVIVRGRRYSDGTNSVSMVQTGTGSSSAGLELPLSGINGICEYLTFDWRASGGVQLSGPSQVGGPSYQGVWRGCKFAHSRTTQFMTPGTNAYPASLDRCEFSNQGAALPNAGLISITQSAGLFQLNGCKFTDFVVGSQLSTTGVLNGSTLADTGQLVMRDTDWGNVTARGPYTAASSQPSNGNPRKHMLFAAGAVGLQEFVLDTKQGFCEWNASRAQPTLNARLRDGTTPMSWRFVPSSNPVSLSFMVPFELPHMVRTNTLPDGDRTFTIEFCLEETLAWNLSHIWPVIEYTDVNGDVAVIDLFDPEGAALTPSSAAWTPLVDGKVTFVDGGTLYHNRYKFVVPTPAGKGVKADSDIIVLLRIAGTGVNLTQGGFVCPEFLVA